MGYMAGVTDDPYSSVGGDAPVAVYDKFVYGFGTSARMLNVYVQFGENAEGQPLVSLEHGADGSWYLAEDVHAAMEVDFAVVAMAVYWYGGDGVSNSSYEGTVERALALVSLRMGEFIEYGHQMIQLENHPAILADVIEYLMSVK